MNGTPTDEQIYELWDEVGQYFALYDDVKNTIREALNRWGTPEPVSLEDRDPQHTDLDEYGSCWWWDEVDECYESLCGDVGGVQSIRLYNERVDSPHKYTHWLPHWAVKLPGDTGNG